MARRIVSRAKDAHHAKDAHQEATDRLNDFVGSDKPRRARGFDKQRRTGIIDEVRGRMKLADWRGMSAGRLVGLYWICHEMVYGVPPGELNNTTNWRNAMLAAGKMVTVHFDGDVYRAVEFMQWVWTREKGREEYRRKTEAPGFRITWKYQFTRENLITDWRASLFRNRGLK